MNINDLTLGQIKEIQAMLGVGGVNCAEMPVTHSNIPVVVCTDKRGGG